MPNVGDRFVIEIEKIISDGDQQYYFMKGFNCCVFDERGIKKLEPYSPDDENLAEDDIAYAYKMGVKEANNNLIKKLKEGDMILLSQEAYKKELDSVKDVAEKNAKETIERYQDYLKSKKVLTDQEYKELKEKADLYEKMIKRERVSKYSPTNNLHDRSLFSDKSRARVTLDDIINEFFGGD